ncbi:MAG TPA: alcohol dehydrogenase catalytic domain-containing protein, partial [Armatimonadota bacterium]
DHVRKHTVSAGLDEAVLSEIPSYVPGDKPTVPGHEVTCRIVAVGDEVQHHRLGERVIVQADYREIKTPGSNAAFGYNFEGALQEYVLMDERVIVDSRGERMLLPVDESLSASAVALVEPWACVEDSYVTRERQAALNGGRLLVVADAGRELVGLKGCYALDQAPGQVTVLLADPGQRAAVHAWEARVSEAPSLTDLPAEGFDDIIYFGHDANVIEALNDALAAHGIMNLVLGGYSIGRLVSIGVGRVHYGGTRWIGTETGDASESYQWIPETGEIRQGDRVEIIGAGGPMGQMHVLRALSLGHQGLEVVAADVDDGRLAALGRKALPLAKVNGVKYHAANTNKETLAGPFDYIAVMAPVGAIVAEAVKDADSRGIINIFAGIPATVRHEIDLDLYVEKHCFMFGTSGSTIEDMKIVLAKVREGQLLTNMSVDAISGMAGALEGLAAVENRVLAGKIIVYPHLHDLGLIPLNKLGEAFPTVAAKLDHGNWCAEAESELLRVAGE